MALSILLCTGTIYNNIILALGQYTTTKSLHWVNIQQHNLSTGSIYNNIIQYHYIRGRSSIMRYVAGGGEGMSKYDFVTGGRGGKPKYDFTLCDVGGGGLDGMIRAELVLYPADPATHPSRIETKHSSKTFMAKLNQTLSLNCLTFVKIGMDGGRGGYPFK